MSEHKVTITWKSDSEDFSYKNYDRSHEWHFEGGKVVKASSAVQYLGKKDLVNPEEALAASISSCHMLSFLAIASRKRWVVRSYTDKAVAILEKNDKEKLAVTKTYLHPEVIFSGENLPTKEEILKMHKMAHEECFIANSVLTEIIVDPVV